nr:methyltransferase [Ktedonobacterales bacterium]
PPDLAAHLVEVADIQPSQRVLEPSVGKGDIADAIRRAHPDALLDVVELHPMLCDILRLKGYQPTECDFLRFAYALPYDRIIMNPPFEHGQDIEHIRRAYALLAEGGTLVAIASPAFEYRSEAKYLDFAEWLGMVDAEVSPLPDNSFTNSDRPTGVATRLIILHK